MNNKLRSNYGLAFYGLQFIFLLFLSFRQPNFLENFFQWDAGWYLNIAKSGYISDFPPTPQDATKANVAFFPALPFSGYLLSNIFGLELRHALIAAGLFWGLVFWIYVGLILEQLRFDREKKILFCTVLFSYVGAYFLLMPYSEGVFLSNFCGALYWIRRNDKNWFLACFHALFLSLSRVSGLILASYFLWAAIKERNLKSLAVFCSALAGVGAFFLFCEWKFGHWDLYFITQKSGWGGEPTLLAAFIPSFLSIPLIKAFNGSNGDVSLLVSSLLSLFIFGCGFLGLVYRRAWVKDQWPILLAGSMVFYFSLSRSMNLGFFGMYRYSLPTIFCWGLALLPANSHRVHKYLKYIVYIICVLSFYLQVLMANRYLTGQWMD